MFGEVYNFQGRVVITYEDESFFGVFHYTPEVGDVMIRALEDPQGHHDKMIIVNSDNLDEYISSLLSTSDMKGSERIIELSK